MIRKQRRQLSGQTNRNLNSVDADQVAAATAVELLGKRCSCNAAARDLADTDRQCDTVGEAAIGGGGSIGGSNREVDGVTRERRERERADALSIWRRNRHSVRGGACCNRQFGDGAQLSRRRLAQAQGGDWDLRIERYVQRGADGGAKRRHPRRGRVTIGCGPSAHCGYASKVRRRCSSIPLQQLGEYSVA